MATYVRALFALAALLSLAFVAAHAPSVAAQGDVQRILGPGLYVFQTRLDHSSCGTPSDSGVVTSYFATIEGVPGSRTMTMRLLNSDYWSTWTLRVVGDRQVQGDSQQDRVEGPRRGDAHFEVTRERDKFIGRGSRSYFAVVDGRQQRCRMAYDALLRRLHD